MLHDETRVDGFTAFVRDAEPRIRQALSASVGSEAAVDGTSEAIAYAWENWDRVESMENAVGYLFVLARNHARRTLRRRPPLLEPTRVELPWVEPGLTGALRRLPERQRVAVMLVYCFDWTLAEVGDVLGLSRSTVQTHAERGLVKLRRSLGVDL